VRNGSEEYKSSLLENTSRHLFCWTINSQICQGLDHRDPLFRCQLRDVLLTRFGMFLVHEIPSYLEEPPSIYAWGPRVGIVFWHEVSPFAKARLDTGPFPRPRDGL